MVAVIVLLATVFSGTFMQVDGGPALTLTQLADIAALCAGALVLGESALLLIGMNVPSVSPWSTPRNLLLASSDVVLGGVITGLALAGRASGGGGLFYAATAALLVTHVFRDAELVLGLSRPFAANPALTVFNNIRLALVGLSFGLTLAA